MFILITGLIDVYTPLYDKFIIDSMTPENPGDYQYRWDLICIYVGLKYIGELYDIKNLLWSNIEHHINKEIEVKVFSQIHNLSLRWHLNRKTGDILKTLDSCTSGITNFLDTILFSLLSIFINVSVSIGYFALFFDIWFGILIGISTILYLIVTIRGQNWEKNLKKDEIKDAREIKNRSIDSLLNYETVKYFGNEKYEINCFENSIINMYKSEYKSGIANLIINSAERFLFNMCLLIGCLLCAYKVVKTKELKVGDYVLFANYLTQLYGSVNWFTYVSRSIQLTSVTLESTFDLLKEIPEVENAPNAKELEIDGANIIFKNVFFEYSPGKSVLKNVSFNIPSGKTLAIVGPTGSGKSTILRLLFRFYDINSGSIQIDQQNINDVTLDSLRKHIGVVPQDTVLFNDTIKYNINYGKLEANDEEIEEAAKGACIHESILNLSDGYDTKVGERGLRLSGGEKQRVAIARTLLKNPDIVLLDEATSALDTKTERNIQETLNNLFSNKTTIIVAHRLSTIAHADQILVLENGVIVERGSHNELIEMDKVYASMWKQQLNMKNEL